MCVPCRPYVAKLDAKSRRWLVKEMKAALGPNSDGKIDLNALRKTVAAFQVLTSSHAHNQHTLQCPTMP